MLKTFRLVVEGVSDEPPFMDSSSITPVCIDVVLRTASQDAMDKVSKEVMSWLNIGPFVGSFVDTGTLRDQEVTLA